MSSVSDRIEVVVGDITRLQVAAIANAANESLLGGGGVDGAIHRAAGPGLLAECRELRGCPTGSAKATTGHGLPAAHVFHAVGPVWRGGGEGEPELLRSCYRRCLELAAEHDSESLAFPSISTGVYGYPKGEAAGIAVSTVASWLATHELPRRVVLCAFSETDAHPLRAELARLTEDPES
ncbi:MAG: O-acetyl-ADP-ribose deacetylase [Acidobacteriota bacterium]